MIRLLFPMISVVVLSFPCSSISAQQIPASLDAKRVEFGKSLIREIFHEEWDQGKTSVPVRQKLAKTLLEQSKKIPNDEEVRYAVLQDARDWAAKAADIETAFTAIAELKKHYKMDTLPLAADVLETCLANTKDNANIKQITTLSISLVMKAKAKDEFPLALRFGVLAEKAAKIGGFPDLVKSAETMQAELAPMLKEYEKIKPFLTKLKSNPDDAEANLRVGKFWCFQKQKWSQGLPYLAKGSDAKLQVLARDELKGAKTGSEQLQLGSAWVKLAEEYKDNDRLKLLKRGYRLLQRARLQLSGPERTKAEEQLKSLVKTIPPEMQSANITEEAMVLKGHQSQVLCVVYSRDGTKLLSCGEDKTVRLWNRLDGKLERTMSGHIGTVFGVAFSLDGKHGFSAGEDNTVRMWDLSNGKEIKQFTGNRSPVNAIAVSPDGKLLASAGQDRFVRIWDIKSGKQIKELQGHAGGVFNVLFSPDGQKLASAGLDEVILWDVMTGKSLQKLSDHKGVALGLSFSPDGKTLLTSAEDRQILLWDLSKSKVIQQFPGHKSTVGSVSFSPSGLRLVSCGDDRTVRIWDSKTGQPQQTLTGHTKEVFRVTYSPDGQQVASASLDGTIRLWEEAK